MHYKIGGFLKKTQKNNNKRHIFLLVLLLILYGGKSQAQYYWGTSGNTGLTPPLDYIGTSDANPLEIKVDGVQSGWIDYTSPYNASWGYGAIISTSPGSENAAFGFFALAANSNLNQNTAIGDSALYSQNYGSVTTTNNVAIGNSALYDNNTGGPSVPGIDNTAVGIWALRYNTIAGYNTAIGAGALYSNTTGTPQYTQNTANGYQALFSNIQGFNNTVAGYQALYTNTSGVSNTAIGSNAGYNSDGNRNTFLGDSAGWDNTYGEANTYLGYQTGGSSSWSYVNNSVWIGYLSSGPLSGPTSDYIYLGNNSTSVIESHNIGPGISTWSDRRVKDSIKENVSGLAFITKIKPVTFHYNINKENELTGIKDNTGNWAGKYDVEKITQSGFIAQQVDSAAQACGYNFNGVTRPNTPGELYALGYDDFVVPLVKAAQELNAKNNRLLSTIDSLHNVFKNMQSCVSEICAAAGNSSNKNSNSAGADQNIRLSSTNVPVLYQNSPNPFSSGTKINYYLPAGTMGASIVFYDSYGNPVKTIQLSEMGNGTLNVTPDNLSNGIYSYSLIVNGNIIDTKKMALQR